MKMSFLLVGRWTPRSQLEIVICATPRIWPKSRCESLHCRLIAGKLRPNFLYMGKPLDFNFLEQSRQAWGGIWDERAKLNHKSNT